MDLNEYQTRKQKIDVMLKEQGWIVGDKSKVWIEVDKKQSDFRVQNYKTVDRTRVPMLYRRIGKVQLLAYLILDSAYSTLLVIP